MQKLDVFEQTGGEPLGQSVAQVDETFGFVEMVPRRSRAFGGANGHAVGDAICGEIGDAIRDGSA